MKKFYKILLIDDDHASNFITRLLLDELNVAEQIWVLENGKDALEFITSHCQGINRDCPNLVFLDLHMPVMGGLDLLAELKRRGETDFINTRIVVLTSSEHAGDMAYLKEVGVRHVLTKPLTQQQVLYITEAFDRDIRSFG